MNGFVAPFNIADVADLLGVRRLTNGTNSFDVECPFCHDKKGKCNLCVTKGGKVINAYNCFHCGESGNMLTLYLKLCGLIGRDAFKEAYREIRDRLHRSGNDGKKYVYNQKEQPIVEVETLDAKSVDEAYRGLLGILGLTEDHRVKLLERGFTDGQIGEVGFRSTPRGTGESVAARLIKRGSNLSGVPGFYINGRGRWDAAFFQKNYGILCPVVNVDGLITGFQIRLDKPFKKKKYVWLSSANLNHGASSGSPVSVFGNPHEKTAYVTEGTLKAALAYCLTGKTFVGVPGVNQCRHLGQTLVDLKGKGLENVIEAHDMDKHMGLECSVDYDDECAVCNGVNANERGMCGKKIRKRRLIRKGCVKLYRICQELGLNVSRLVWDMGESDSWLGNYKGIDDHLYGLKLKGRTNMRQSVKTSKTQHMV